MALTRDLFRFRRNFLSPVTLMIPVLCLGVAGCATTPYRFALQEPRTNLEDQQAIPVPEKQDLNIREYVIASSGRFPMLRYLNTARVAKSQDVNALDDVPESSWFTRRMGYRELPPSEIAKGPEKLGPPQPPYEIVKLKTEGTNPGFHIRDVRGYRYLVKLDSPDAARLETTINYVVSRLFWAFGYNVPEDYIFRFKRDQLRFPETGQIATEDVDALLSDAVIDKDGAFRTTASLFLQGTVIGHPDQNEFRKDDPNDRIPHRDMRVLRGLKIFCALTQQTAMRSDNMLDVYEGAPDKGYIRHYLIDFGETMGVHGLSWQWPWDGFEHFFDWKDHLKDITRLGFPTKAWENIHGDPQWVGTYYESKAFQLRNWKEVFQFEPIRRSQPDDDYWAAKIIAPLREVHLETLFREASHGDEATVRYLIKTLMERRQKILSETFERVTPLESNGIHQNQLQLVDQAALLFKDKSSATKYFIEYFDGDNQKIREPDILGLREENLTIPIDPTLLEKKDGYLRLQIRPFIPKNSSRPAQFHIRKVGDEAKVIGVTH